MARMNLRTVTPPLVAFAHALIAITFISAILPLSLDGGIDGARNISGTGRAGGASWVVRAEETTQSDNTCGSEDVYGNQSGQCDNNSRGPRVDKVFEIDHDGSLIIHAPSKEPLIYKQEFRKNYGGQVSSHLRKLSRNSRVLEELQFQLMNDKQQLDDHEMENALFQTVETSLLLIDDLLGLSLIHKEDWISSMSDISDLSSMPHHSQHGQTRQQQQKKQTKQEEDFNRCVVAYEASLELYLRTWELIRPNDSDPDNNSELLQLGILDQEAISIGIANIYLNLSDMFHQRYNYLTNLITLGLGAEDGMSGGDHSDYSAAYRYLIHSEKWCATSLKLLGVDLDDSESKPKRRYSSYHREEFDGAIEDAKQSLSLAQIRMGMLLLDMYAMGYRLDSEGNLRLDNLSSSTPADSFSSSPSFESSKDHKEIVMKALDRLQKGSKGQSSQNQPRQSAGYYYDYEDPYQEYENLLNKADTHCHLGIAYGYLLQWADAIAEWERCLELYNEIIQSAERDSSSRGTQRRKPLVDLEGEALTQQVAGNILQTSQSLWEAYLHVGKLEEAKGAFHQHLLCVRYLERGISMAIPLDQGGSDEELEDLDGDGVDEMDSFADLQYTTGPNDLSDQADLTETLETYRKMLDEYHQLLKSMPQYEMGIGYEQMDIIYSPSGQEGSYLSQDKVYEGSLHSAMGSIHLALNQVREARDELELGVQLLREGMEDEDETGERAYDYEILGEDGQNIPPYSLSLDLADALLNLAYTHLSLKQFRKSYETFEEAMDRYSDELKEGESIWDHSSLEGSFSGGGSENLGRERKKEQYAGWKERLSRFFGGGDPTEKEETTAEKANYDDEDIEEKTAERANYNDEDIEEKRPSDGVESMSYNFYIDIDDYDLNENGTLGVMTQ